MVTDLARLLPGKKCRLKSNGDVAGQERNKVAEAATGPYGRPANRMSGKNSGGVVDEFRKTGRVQFDNNERNEDMSLIILLAISTGLIWSLSGVVMSRATRLDFNIGQYFVANSLFSALLVMVVLVDWPVLLTGVPARLMELTLVLLGAGGMNAAGLVLLQRAMQYGHNGLSWTLAQAALVIPFVAGMVFWDVSSRFAQWMGVGLIVLGMLLAVLKTSSNAESVVDRKRYCWLGFTLSAFLCIGISQTLQGVPSYWRGWSDTAQLRVGLLAWGNVFGFLFLTPLLGTRSWRPRRPIVFWAGGMAVLGIIGAKMLFVVLDGLAHYGTGSIGFPLIVGSCIAGFSLFSLVVLREKSSLLHWLGLAATLSGIIVISQ